MPDGIPFEREQKFPNLRRTAYHKTSEPDEFYNCIAYAAGDRDRWWQPPTKEGIEDPGWFWPEGAPSETTVESLVSAYQLVNFQICDDSLTEVGFEKIAIYGYSDGQIAHVARLLDNGKWSSKLGDLEDIIHETCAALEGEEPAYGQVKLFMKRPVTNVGE